MAATKCLLKSLNVEAALSAGVATTPQGGFFGFHRQFTTVPTVGMDPN